jgi:putative otsA trehalose-6-phosphate synthase
MKEPQFYFINYKNSIAGVGGVGTVSRDLIEYYPGVRCIFWDGTKAIRGSDVGINLGNGVNHGEVHLLFFKKYLWSLLHGIECKISDKQLNIARRDLRKQVAVLVNKIVQEIGTKNNSFNGDIFWINDYTALPLVRELRDHYERATIVFSFRTPFGREGFYPNIQQPDVGMFVDLLNSDLITFHRRCDMLTYIKFLEENATGVIDKARAVDDFSILILTKDGHTVELLVVPMGNNLQYRQSLAYTKEAREIVKKIRSDHKGKKIITSISRFEQTKGVEYEIDLVNTLIKKHPELKDKFVFMRYTYRSKKKIDDYEYSALHDRVLKGVENINRKYGGKSWTPIIYSNEHKLTDQEVTAVLQASDIVIVASVADGFNHLALEAIHSQTQEMPKVQLLLSNIGATDYIKGYNRLKLSLEDDVEILYKALVRSEKEVNVSYKELRSSASRLSSRSWLDTIISRAQIISESKGGKR